MVDLLPSYTNNAVPSGDGWADYYTYEEYPSQMSNEALRYQLAHLAYSSVAFGYYKTPAYPELTVSILKDLVQVCTLGFLSHNCQRMIHWKVWDYVKLYWKDQPTYPVFFFALAD
jgi:hypothetical protein